jgi:heat shock protein HslJ
MIERSQAGVGDMSRRKQRSGVVLGALVASILTFGCSSNAQSSLTQADLVGNWVGSTPLSVAPSGYWWTFGDDGRYRYFDGCNWGGGLYEVKAGEVVFGESEGSTARGCLSGAVSLSEPPHFQVVEKGKSLKVETTSGEVTLDYAAELPPVG